MKAAAVRMFYIVITFLMIPTIILSLVFFEAWKGLKEGVEVSFSLFWDAVTGKIGADQ